MEPDTIFIATTARGDGVAFSRDERERHIAIVGKTGSGKSTLLFNLIMNDIRAGAGVAVIDPHGDLAEDILDAIPRSRINHVCYLDAGETEYPVGFNPMTRVAPHRRALATAGFLSAFQHLWSDSWGPRLEHFLYHGVAALMSRQRATLIDLPRLYTDDQFRERVLAHVADRETRRFWNEEYPRYSKQLRADAIAPILNKAGQFTASPQLRLILGQVAPRLDLAFTMNNQRILIVNLNKGRIGEKAANLLGSLITSHLQLVAMERAELPQHERVPFFVHIDEAQTITSDVFASLFSEARKFALHFVLANQYMSQFSDTVRAALIGNVGTMIVYRVGGHDAELLAPEFHVGTLDAGLQLAPEHRPMSAGDLVAQEPYTAWLRRGIARDRITAHAPAFEPVGTRNAIRDQSRHRFGRHRNLIG